MIKTNEEKDFRKELKQTFVFNAKKYADEKGLKQIEIARKLHVSKASVSTWFSTSNNVLPESTKIRELAELLGVSMETLLKGKEVTPESEIASLFNALSVDQKQQVLDFIAFLKAKE